jgi:hypothetical protein
MAKQMGKAKKERRADSIYMVLILAHWHDTIVAAIHHIRCIPDHQSI